MEAELNNHLNARTLCDLFDARAALSEDGVAHLNACARCGAVFLAFTASEFSDTDDDIALRENEERWEDAAFDLAFGDGEPDPLEAQNILSTDTAYAKVYLRILGASADRAKNKLIQAGDMPARREKTPLEGARDFFDHVAFVACGLATDLKDFLAAPDFSGFVPARRFRTFAATAAPDALRQHVAEGQLPNAGGYKVIYGPFETILEIEAFSPLPPKVLYYRANNDKSAFEPHTTAWTSAKPDKWVMRLSPDHPAIIALPEWNYVILAQSYKSLQR